MEARYDIAPMDQWHFLGPKIQHFSPHCGDLEPDQFLHPECVSNTVVVGKPGHGLSHQLGIENPSRHFSP